MRRKKGFTLVELLVVIAIIALLMGILMPALARVREVAYRLICGTNLSGIGKSMVVYANDYNERFPRAGHRRSVWGTGGRIRQWDALDPIDAFVQGGGRESSHLEATVTSSLYLLIKHADVTTKQFVCKGDTGSTVFKLSEHPANLIDGEPAQLTDVHDFGGEPGNDGTPPGEHVSYAYQLPYHNSIVENSFPVSAIRNPQSPVAADKNPYLDNNIDFDSQEGQEPELISDAMGTYLRDSDHWLNSFAHQREGQNVLYADVHVNFENKPTVGINKDNIWQCWGVEDFAPANQGLKIYNADFEMTCEDVGAESLASYDYDDAFLVNECTLLE